MPRLDNVKPCPFCGHRPVWYERYLSYGIFKKQLRCDNPDCFVTLHTGELYTEAECVEAWNKRA